MYLLTEGLAGIGHAMATELTRRTRQPRLVLVEGTGFPPREQWAGWLASHGPEDTLGRKIQSAQALESAGATVRCSPPGSTDEAQMRHVVSQTLEHFGRLDGVIHAAGGLQEATLRAIQETGPQRV